MPPAAPAEPPALGAMVSSSGSTGGALAVGVAVLVGGGVATDSSTSGVSGSSTAACANDGTWPRPGVGSNRVHPIPTK